MDGVTMENSMDPMFMNYFVKTFEKEALCSALKKLKQYGVAAWMRYFMASRIWYYRISEVLEQYSFTHPVYNGNRNQ